MSNFGLLKRGCLGLVMLFGFGVVGGFGLGEVAYAGDYIDGSGCVIISGDLNLGRVDTVKSTNASHCGNFDPSDNVSFSGAKLINPTNSLVGGGVAYTGAQPVVPVSLVGFSPLDSSLFTSIERSNECKDFFGQTNDNPVVNQGVIDFDNEEPDGDYRTCLQLLGSPVAGEVHYGIDGWAWNTNLGWVSTMSNGGMNRGLVSGAVDFSSSVKVSPSFNGEGELFGFWWNDAAGWIKLNCAADGVLNSFDVANCAADGGEDYGVYIVSFDVSTGRAVLGGYAWSDSVGYIDFTGVHVNLPGLNPDYEAKVEYVKVNENEEVYANGENGYKIRVSFYDGATNVTGDFADVALENSFCLVYQDFRKINELVSSGGGVTNTNRTGNAPFYSCGDESNQRAMEDDLNMNQLGWDGRGVSVLMDNFSDRFVLKGRAGQEYFESNVNVVSRIPTVSGELKLRQVFMYNDFTGFYKEVNSPTTVGRLDFEPPYDLNIIGGEVLAQSDCKQGDLVLEFDRPVKASICGEFYADGGGIANLRTGIIGEPKVNSAYSSKFDSITASNDEQGKSVFRDELLVSQSGYGVKDLWFTVNLAQGVEIEEVEPLKSLMDLTIVSKVSYTLPSGATVYRYGPELSNDTQNIFELNIQGGLADRSFGSTSFSSGSKDTQGANRGLKVKEMVYRVLRNIIQMNPKPGNCGEVEFVEVQRDELGEILGGCGRVSSAGGRNVVFIGARDRGGLGEGGYVLYSELTELIESQVSDERKHPVVVLYGVDLIVDEQILPIAISRSLDKGKSLEDMSSELDQVLGLVVLESESGGGGEVLVTANVTDFVGYVYADGRMLSAPDVSTAIAAASGDADNVLNRGIINEDLLYNQFSFAGVLYSSNCIGCASNIPALRSDGSVAESRLLSLNDDLNAFRYTPLVFDVVYGEVEVQEKDAYGNPTEKTVMEPYVCLLPCGVDEANYNPQRSNGQFENECINVESKITTENACFDESKYDVNGGVNKLSLIEEFLAGGTGSIKQLEKIKAANPSKPSYGDLRSVNIRSLEVPEGMPVFSVISE